LGRYKDDPDSVEQHGKRRLPSKAERRITGLDEDTDPWFLYQLRPKFQSQYVQADRESDAEFEDPSGLSYSL
jgi:hypothetical protein